MKKYNILILGGTRFIGKSLLIKLMEYGHSVTISSRRAIYNQKGLRQITCLRSDLRKYELKLNHFDYVYDFNAYKVQDILDLPTGQPKKAYFLLSSQWLADKSQKNYERRFSQNEREYIENKKNLELALSEKFGPKSKIIRLPVVIGNGDHHQRLSFLVYRISTKHKLIVHDGEYPVDFIWVNDVVEILTKTLCIDFEYPQVVRILSEQRNTYIQLIREIENLVGLQTEHIPLNFWKYREKLPNFCLADAFWREELIIREEINLGKLVCHNEIPVKLKFNLQSFNSFNSQLIGRAIQEEVNYLNGRY